MTNESQIRKELEQAGYKLVRHGKHEIWKNDKLKHTITACASSRDRNGLRIIKGLIRRGKRQKH